jgi:hypothetical protein
VTNKNSQITNIIMTSKLPTIKPGNYKVNIYYKLPGIDKPISTKAIVIPFNP